MQSALNSVKGVKSAKVSLAERDAVITYDPTEVKVADLINAVDHAHGGMGHYSATLKGGK